MYYIGIDIGGTKCSVSLGETNNNEIVILNKEIIETGTKKPYLVLVDLLRIMNKIIEKAEINISEIKSIGISCGGPLDSKNGIILSPPNLPGWNNIKAVSFFENATDIKTYLQNDANACAVAEWKYGAGRGCSNIIFLTFGTGLGAGLILNGQLYSGTNDNAGEIGHIRLTDHGPVGYNKIGSAEGWCSGGGIAQIGRMAVEKEQAAGNHPRLLETAGSTENITAKLIGDLAEKENDYLCLEIYRICGEKLGLVLSILTDILNPELIIIGGIYMRSAELLSKHITDVFQREVLSPCPIVSAGLGEKVGDYAALSIAVSNDE